LLRPLILAAAAYADIFAFSAPPLRQLALFRFSLTYAIAAIISAITPLRHYIAICQFRHFIAIFAAIDDIIG
jgi:hypothetical protein